MDITETRRNILNVKQKQRSDLSYQVYSHNTFISNLQKFRRDNEISFTLWVMLTGAQLTTRGTAQKNGKWKTLLLGCTEPVDFGAATDTITLNLDVTYAELKVLLNENDCRTENKRNLELKLIGLGNRKYSGH